MADQGRTYGSLLAGRAVAGTAKTRECQLIPCCSGRRYRSNGTPPQFDDLRHVAARQTVDAHAEGTTDPPGGVREPTGGGRHVLVALDGITNQPVIERALGVDSF